MENQPLFLEPQKIEIIGQTVSLKTREMDTETHILPGESQGQKSVW